MLAMFLYFDPRSCRAADRYADRMATCPNVASSGSSSVSQSEWPTSTANRGLSGTFPDAVNAGDLAAKHIPHEEMRRQPDASEVLELPHRPFPRVAIRNQLFAVLHHFISIWIGLLGILVCVGRQFRYKSRDITADFIDEILSSLRGQVP